MWGSGTKLSTQNFDILGVVSYISYIFQAMKTGPWGPNFKIMKDIKLAKMSPGAKISAI
jgi:hypothetical protein